MLTFAVVAALLAALVAVASMLPLRFPTRRDKQVAIAAAAADRLLLGFVVGPVAAALNVNGLVIGSVLGLGLSIGSALVTKSYLPILALGTLLGAAVGLAYELVF